MKMCTLVNSLLAGQYTSGSLPFVYLSEQTLWWFIVEGVEVDLGSPPPSPQHTHVASRITDSVTSFSGSHHACVNL